MILNKPKRLIAVLNGFEIGVESPKNDQDAVEFDLFCETLRAEISKMIKKPEASAPPMVAHEAVS